MKTRHPASAPTAPPTPETPPISRLGWKIIGGGILLLLLGFITLSFTDPKGQNWASHLSPFILLGGYALIGFGIVKKG